MTNPIINQKWIQYTSQPSYNVNLEHISSINDLTGKEVQEYVFRTLEVLQKYRKTLSAYHYHLIERTLQWSEVAKCGSEADQTIWKAKYHNMDIHNEASASIYHSEVTLGEAKENEEFNQIVELLIQTHGLLGQAVRGEVNVACSKPLRKLLDFMPIDEAITVITILNECILTAVNPTIWTDNEDQIRKLIDRIFYNIPYEYTIDYRIQKLIPQLETNDDTRQLMSFFTPYQLWYMPAAFKDIPADTTIDILKAIKTQIMNKKYIKPRYIKHIIFKIKSLSTNRIQIPTASLLQKK